MSSVTLVASISETKYYHIFIITDILISVSSTSHLYHSYHLYKIINYYCQHGLNVEGPRESVPFNKLGFYTYEIIFKMIYMERL